MRLTLEVSENNEITRSPYWLIIDPAQNFRTDARGVTAIASMVTGPFFSREDAEGVLSARRYRFGKGATVFCCSGYMSPKYDAAFRERKAT